VKEKFVCSQEECERFNKSPSKTFLGRFPGHNAVFRINESGNREYIGNVVCEIEGTVIETIAEGCSEKLLDNSRIISIAKEFVHGCAIAYGALREKHRLDAPRKWGGEQSTVPMYQQGEPGKVKGFFIPVECEGQTPKSVRYKIEELTPGEKQEPAKPEEVMPGWMPSDNVIAKFGQTDSSGFFFYLRRSDTHLTIMRRVRSMSDYAVGRIDSPGNGYVTYPTDDEVLKAALAFVENCRPDKEKPKAPEVLPPDGCYWSSEVDCTLLLTKDCGIAIGRVPRSKEERDAMLACVERFDPKMTTLARFDGESFLFRANPVLERGRYAVSFRKLPTG